MQDATSLRAAVRGVGGARAATRNCPSDRKGDVGEAPKEGLLREETGGRAAPKNKISLRETALRIPKHSSKQASNQSKHIFKSEKTYLRLAPLMVPDSN